MTGPHSLPHSQVMGIGGNVSHDECIRGCLHEVAQCIDYVHSTMYSLVQKSLFMLLFFYFLFFLFVCMSLYILMFLLDVTLEACICKVPKTNIINKAGLC